MVDLESLAKIKKELEPFKARLVAVSKTKPVEDIYKIYQAGHKEFGENYVQELLIKKDLLPPDVQWHFIGHLQRNKAKEIIPFIHLIHSIDSLKLLAGINKIAANQQILVNCLLQIYIAEEETKFGLSVHEADAVLSESGTFTNVKIAGLMGMATNTTDQHTIQKEFKKLYAYYESNKNEYGFSVLSMGMTSDYKIALDCGSNMVRIGSALFGERQKPLK